MRERERERERSDEDGAGSRAFGERDEVVLFAGVGAHLAARAARRAAVGRSQVRQPALAYTTFLLERASLTLARALQNRALGRRFRGGAGDDST